MNTHYPPMFVLTVHAALLRVTLALQDFLVRLLEAELRTTKAERADTLYALSKNLHA